MYDYYVCIVSVYHHQWYLFKHCSKNKCKIFPFVYSHYVPFKLETLKFPYRNAIGCLTNENWDCENTFLVQAGTRESLGKHRHDLYGKSGKNLK